MFNDIIIGKGPSACTTVHVFEIEGKHNISQNNIMFRSSVYGRNGITIYKSSKEGIKLIDMIQKKKSLDSINKYIEKLFFKKASIELIQSIIKNVETQAYNDGKSDMQKEIKKTLGIYPTY